MNTSEVLAKFIVSRGLSEAMFHIISHEITPNWRVENPTTEQKIADLSSGMVQHVPLEHHYFSGRDIILSKHSSFFDESVGLSICSDFLLNSNKFHIPMMNLHTEFSLDSDLLIPILQTVSGMDRLVLMSSGRYFHVYFLETLSEGDWIKFLASFLMPTILVSPRYVGHSLHRGYTTLRLFPCVPLKPQQPHSVWSNWHL